MYADFYGLRALPFQQRQYPSKMTGLLPFNPQEFGGSPFVFRLRLKLR
jgi:hypothetical protein